MPGLAELDVYQVDGTRRTFANIASTWAFGFRNNELAVSSRDPEEVMRQLPEGVICFRFYDRIVANVEMNERIIQVQSERLNVSAEQYFVDSDRVYKRSQTLGWWRSDWYKNLRQEMDEHHADHAVTWGKPYYKNMAYRPDVDVLLSRWPLGQIKSEGW